MTTTTTKTTTRTTHQQRFRALYGPGGQEPDYSGTRKQLKLMRRDALQDLRACVRELAATGAQLDHIE